MENIRQTGMIKICKKLTSDLNIDLSEMRALDFYAGEGDWQTSVLSDYVKDIDAWEVGKQFEENLVGDLISALDSKKKQAVRIITKKGGTGKPSDLEQIPERGHINKHHYSSWKRWL